jgi:hypothetical protein
MTNPVILARGIANSYLKDVALFISAISNYNDIFDDMGNWYARS